jgi:hypothetical protein
METATTATEMGKEEVTGTDGEAGTETAVGSDRIGKSLESIPRPLRLQSWLLH